MKLRNELRHLRDLAVKKIWDAIKWTPIFTPREERTTTAPNNGYFLTYERKRTKVERL